MPKKLLSIQPGGIYRTRDVNIYFTDRAEIDDKDKPRMVVVLGSDDDIQDIMIPHVFGLPVTTCFDYGRSTQDYIVGEGTANLDKTSIIKTGMIQPVLKMKLEKKVGQLDDDVFDEIKAQIQINLGFTA
jgi:mRNA-degrading endonuclease toxin of MazEF toxin-antitoxin module